MMPQIATQAVCARVFLRAMGKLYKVSNSVSSASDIWFVDVSGCWLLFRLQAIAVFVCQEGCAKLSV